MEKRPYMPSPDPIARTPHGAVWYVPSVGCYYVVLTNPERALVVMDDEDGSETVHEEQEVRSFWTHSPFIVCQYIGHTDKDESNPVVIDHRGQYTII